MATSNNTTINLYGISKEDLYIYVGGEYIKYRIADINPLSDFFKQLPNRAAYDLGMAKGKLLSLRYEEAARGVQ